MTLDNLILDIHFNIVTRKFEFNGNVNEKGRRELVETFLGRQIGRGKDNSKPNEQNNYHIQLKWYPENDRIEVSSDTGNLGLRDGILIYYLKSLDK